MYNSALINVSDSGQSDRELTSKSIVYKKGCGRLTTTKFIVIYDNYIGFTFDFCRYSRSKRVDSLLYYRQANHTNYAIETFQLLAKVGGIASLAVANQLIWSHCVNPSGQIGRNIPADLAMEHLNRFLKSYVHGLHANVSEKTIVQVSKALRELKKVCDNFDGSVGLHPDSFHHTSPSSKADEISELAKNPPFIYTPGRTMKCCKNLKPSVTSQIDPNNLIHWLNKQKENLSNDLKFAKLFK